jgi:hypothetical protein
VTKLKISSELSLPLDVIQSSIALLATKGAGKTYTGSVLAEETYEAGVPLVVLDPVGVWWGLRSSADGKGPGLPIVIMGGERGDVPLEESAGKVVADFIVAERVSVLLDLSHLRKGPQSHFVTDFAEELYHKNRQPLFLIVDEADEFAPQRPVKGRERCLGAMEDIARRARARGIGSAFITQRSAVLNKDVLTQCPVLITLRTVGPQDIAAIDEWIKRHGDPEKRAQLMESIAAMPTGTAWVWAPEIGIFKRVKIRRRETFDSSATPKIGQKRIEPKTVADVDLDALQRRMASTIEKQKASDPKELQKEITRLRGELARKPQVSVSEPVRIEIPVITDDQVKKLDQAAHLLADAQAKFEQALGAATEQLADAFQEPVQLSRQILDAVTAVRSDGARSVAAAQRRLVPATPVAVTRAAPRRPAAAPAAETGEKLGLAERKILTVLAQYPQGRTIKQIAVLTGYAIGGGGFRNALGSLRTKGYVEGRGDNIQSTEGGLTALGEWEALPAPGSELLAHWRGELGHAESEILRVLSETYPAAMTPEEIAAQTTSAKGGPYEPDGGGFRNALGRLRTLELVDGRGALTISKDLMEVA